MMQRRKIKHGDKVPVQMTSRERELMLEFTLADPEYVARLQTTTSGRELVGEYTLDDLEDIIGYVAAEANHTENKALQRELDALYDRLHRIQRSYDDGSWNDSAL